MAVLLDHIAEFLLFLSDAPSFWYTLNTSYDHGLHLSRMFGLSPHDYECLLAAANLAHYTKSGFTIKPKEWKMFLDGHDFAVVEGIDECKVWLDKKKLCIEKMIDRMQPGTKRSEFYVLQIGVVDEVSPQKFEWQIDEQRELIMAPPRMNSLRMEQQSFRKLVKPFIWNYIVENKLDEDEDDDDDDDEDDNNDLTTVVAITLLPMGRKKHKLNDIDPSVTLPDDNDVERLYPYLSRALGG